MRKLELKDIQSYPIGENGIKFHSPVVFTDEKPTVLTIDGYSIGYHGVWVDLQEKEGDYPLCVLLEDVFPILRPMSDIIKPIIVEGYNEGKEFIPLVELAKLAYKEIYSEYSIGDFNTKKIEPNPKSDGSYQIGHFSYKDGMFEFLEYGEVVKRNKNDLNPFVEIVHTPLKQYQYFDLLNQWLFDYRGLIEMNLGININTLQK